MIGPPYFKLDAREQRAHLLAAAAACAPLPFYVYEFAATAGYAFDPSMLARLREEADNLDGDEGLGHALGGVRALPARRASTSSSGPRR